MKVALFSSQDYDQAYFDNANRGRFTLQYFPVPLSVKTVPLCQGFDAVCVFVNDDLSAQVLEQLEALGVKHLALRCAGYNNLDLDAFQRIDLSVSRVPAYSPEAVAEHTLALILTLNRKLHKAYNRVKENNFSLSGLLGFNLHGKTIGVIGTGRIGSAFVRLMKGFGCQILCHDLAENPELVDSQCRYVGAAELFASADIISLHCPLTPDTQHFIGANALAQMKPGVMLINTSRGALIDTKAVIASIKTGHIGYLGLDVYEMESDLFFRDLSSQVIQDDVFQRLLTFPNVLITGHQGFFTHEALTEIADTTLNNCELALHGQSDPDTFLVI